MTCGECKWWDNGRCRLRPPVVIPARRTEQPGDPLSVTVHYGLTIWPKTKPDDWCEEFAAKEEGK